MSKKVLLGAFVVFSLAIVTKSRPDESVGQVLRPSLNHSFVIKDDQFVKDGTPMQLLAGSIHYFRIHPDYWRDRLLRVRALGLNTVQTFIPWNIHEPQPRVFSFSGRQDLAAFVHLAQELGLSVMLRLGPYACGEVEFGGFPSWLLTRGPMALRTSDPKFLAETDAWWSELLPRVKPWLIHNGGPVIMVQVENEYGWFGITDQAYLQHLVDRVRAALGPDIIIYTTDTAFRSALEQGTLKGGAVYTAVDFNVYTDPEEAFALQREYNLPGMSPPFSAEYYTGWHTRWGEPLSKSGSGVVTQGLQKLLDMKASVSLYVAHGGTNFGFSNGANTFSETDYRPVITSYDYGAPVSEGGDLTFNHKFKEIRKAFIKAGAAPPDPPPAPKKVAFGALQVHEHATLLDNLAALCEHPDGISSWQIKSMEFFNQSYGFILYKTSLPDRAAAGDSLSLIQVHDRAQVFVELADGTRLFIGTIGRWSPRPLTLSARAAVPGATLAILVENMGRTSFGDYMWDQKGITQAVLLNGEALHDWRVFPLPLLHLSGLKFQLGLPRPPAARQKPSGRLRLPKRSALENEARFHDTQSGSHMQAKEVRMHRHRPVHLPSHQESSGFHDGEHAMGPVFFRAQLDLEKGSIADTYLSTSDWSKGVAFINNFNLGRYWSTSGPQCTLYIPAPVLKQGKNDLVLLELDSVPSEPEILLLDAPDYSCAPVASQQGWEKAVSLSSR